MVTITENPKELLFYVTDEQYAEQVEYCTVLYLFCILFISDVLYSTEKLKCHSSALTGVLSKLCCNEILSVAIKHGIQCLKLDMSVGLINNCIWQSFADTVVQSFLIFVFGFCFSFDIVTVCMYMYVLLWHNNKYITV